MSLYDLRQSIESAIPWWVPVGLAACFLCVYLVMERRGK